MRSNVPLPASKLALLIAALVPLTVSPPVRAADTKSSADTKPKLYTVPEDGSGNDDMPASSRLVRDLLGAHPNEDLVICIAGCRPGIDRVIFAQPADLTKKAPAVAETQSEPQPQAAATPAATAEPVKVEPAKAEAAKSEAAKPEPAKSQPDAAPASEPAAEPARDITTAPQEAPATEGTRMEPTAAEPEAEEPKSEGAEKSESSESSSDEPSSESSSDESSDAPSSRPESER